MINREKETVAALLFDYMDSMEIIDTHEHLLNESERLKETVDFSKMFTQYTHLDLSSSGMSADSYNKFTSSELDVEAKWKLFEPYYKKIRNGSYTKAARLSMKRIYNVDDLATLDDAITLTENMRKANQPGLYRKVLKDICNIKVTMNFHHLGTDRDFFLQVDHMNHFCEISTLNELDAITSSAGNRPTSLKSYVDTIGRIMEDRKKNGLRGIKFHTAYNRNLKFENVSICDAERIFSKIYDETMGFRIHGLGFSETIPLQDFLVHQMIQMAGEMELPVVFHTGITGTSNNLDNARPLPLWNLFHRYSNVQFLILHGGIPWVDEAGILAKNFANVYVDMAWMHIISPELSVKALKTWVDMVPQNKIFGFGGDYAVIEKVYGHLIMAKENIARTLAAKIEDGAMTESEAYSWINSLLYDNPSCFYGIC